MNAKQYQCQIWTGLALCALLLIWCRISANAAAPPATGIGPGYSNPSSTTTNNPYDPSELCVPDAGVCCTAPAETGTGAEECPAANAMPVWKVTEPVLNLWLHDRPIWYQPGRGPQMGFDLFFKNIQGTNGMVDNAEASIFGVGTNWHTKWRAYAKELAGGEVLVFLGDGSARTYTLNQIDYHTSRKLTAGSQGYVLTAPDGSIWRFEGDSDALGAAYWFLTSHTDRHGNTTQLYYAEILGTVLLTDVRGPENEQFSFDYTSAGPYDALISTVSGPGGQIAYLSYDNFGRLTNIVDMGGLGTGFHYDSTNNLRHMITPFGTTTFTVWATATNWAAIKVAEVGMRTNFWVYLDNDTVPRVLADNSYSEPTTIGSLPGDWDSGDGNLRNSFFWNQRRIEQLSSTVRSAVLSDAFDPGEVTSGDFQLARQRHWLRNAGGTVGRTLSFERAPTPDGVEDGQITWYDYEGKADPWKEGTQFLPRGVAWKLPDTTSRYTILNRNSLGYPTNSFETYQSSGSIRSNRFEYAANGIDLTRHVRYLADGSERMVSSNVFNASHLVLAHRNALSETNVYTYDGSNRLTSILRPSGLFTTNFYDASGRLDKAIDRDGTGGNAFRTNAYTWTNGWVLTHTDPRGEVITNTYDAFGRMVQQNDERGVMTYTYNKLDLIKTTDRMGFVRSNLFDALRRPVRQVDARGNTNSFAYCSCGSLDYATNELGEVTHFAYDFQGRRTITFHPDNYYVTNHWNSMQERVKVSDNDGHRITNAFNQQGLLVAADTAGGRLFSRTYDIEDNVVSSTDANGVTTTNAFDALERLVARGLSATNSVETLAWTARGLLYSVNPLGKGLTNAYDAIGRKTAETNANGEVAQFAYSPGNDMVTLTDAKSHVTTWRHDRFGRLTNKVDHLGTNVFIYSYDANNRLTNRWTPGDNPTVGINTCYAVDPNGNVTLVVYPTTTNTYAYDALNRLTNMMDSVGTTRYTYTTAGALASEDGPWDSDTVSYDYTTGRQRRKLTLLQPNVSKWEQSYDYDLARRLTNTTSPAGVFRYEYTTTTGTTPGRLIKKLTLGNGAYVTNAYDGLARLASTILKDGNHNPLNAHSYEMNEDHQRTKQTRIDGDYVDYAYDFVGQLTSALGKESGGSSTRWNEQFRYSYDAAGNLSERVANLLTNVFNVDSLNQLTSVVRANSNLTVVGNVVGTATNVSVADNGNSPSNATLYADGTFARPNVTAVNGANTLVAVAQDADGRADTNTVSASLPIATVFAYDLNGNMRTNGTRIFDYDSENQLIRIMEPNAWKSEFAYDGRMRRRIERNFEWRGGAWVTTNEVRFVYDATIAIQERDSFNIPQLTLTRGLDLRSTLQRAGGIGGLLALTESAQRGAMASHNYYHADANGNVTALIDSDQHISGRYTYTPFGSLLSLAGNKANVNRYRFSSKEQHIQSGLVYFMRRYYAPDCHRWLNRDPITEKRDNNLYRMVRNNMPNKVDPIGLADIYTVGELDLVGILGLDLQVGFVFDTDKPLDSGWFVTCGVAGGANVGAAVGVGYAPREIEGTSINGDINAGAVGIAASIDDQGYNGASITVGPGGGGSASVTTTGTLNIGTLICAQGYFTPWGTPPNGHSTINSPPVSITR